MTLFEIYCWGALGMGFVMAYVIKYHTIIILPSHMRWATWAAIGVMMMIWFVFAAGFIAFMCKKCINNFKSPYN